MSYELSTVQNFGLGAYAAIVEGLLLQPTLYWKNARAWKLPFTLNLRVIYRGTAASVLNEVNMLGMQFGLTAVFQKFLAEGNLLSPSHQVYSAVLGGTFSSFVTSPMELMMIQQQVHSGRLACTVRRVLATGGWGSNGMFRGLIPSIARDTIYVGGLLGITPIVYDYLTRELDMSPCKAGIASSVFGGIVAALPSHPFDVAKTCMAGDLERNTYTDFRTTFKQLCVDGGKRLFHGAWWRTVNIVATVYIVNEVRMQFPKYLYATH